MPTIRRRTTIPTRSAATPHPAPRRFKDPATNKPGPSQACLLTEHPFNPDLPGLFCQSHSLRPAPCPGYSDWTKEIDK